MATMELPRPVSHVLKTYHKRRLRPFLYLALFLLFLLLLSPRLQLGPFRPPILPPPVIVPPLSPNELQSAVTSIPKAITAPALPPPSPPLSNLGVEADASFHLSPPTPELYLSTLTTFITRAFPPTLHPLLLGSLTLSPAHPAPFLPKRIWQTHRTESEAPLDTTRTWWESNPESEGWNRTFLSDSDADAWVTTNLADSEMEWVWRILPPGVLRSDLLRYLVLLVEGGVYSDTDTVCLKRIGLWGRGADLWGEGSEDTHERARDREKESAGLPPRGVLVGVEADVGQRSDWHQWWPRPLQIVQWTLASPPHHPIMLDAVRRVHAATVAAAHYVLAANNSTDVQGAREEMGGPLSVMEWTGPGIFTDSVMTYLMHVTSPPPRPPAAASPPPSRWGGFFDSPNETSTTPAASPPAPPSTHTFTWPSLRSLTRPLRIHDVTVLPVTGFAPGTGLFNSKSVSDEQAMVEHRFAGSWKSPGRTSF